MLKEFVTGLSKVLDTIAGLCMVITMALIVINVILRGIFNRPILGTYEYVGFLTAVMIGFALAYCAVQKGHIAVGFIMDRFSTRIQAIVNTAMYGIALTFWTLTAWHLGNYAYRLSVKGVVSPTMQAPFYYFIYLVAIGLLVLCLVLLVELIESIKRAAVAR
ncbi:MAG: TRAP transporter small permease [Bacillota bacterium]